MTISQFSALNRLRCEAPDGFNHKLSAWSLSDWLVAVLGELGEAANLAKKLNRIRDGVPGNGALTESEIRAELADELADTFIYLDLVFQSLGLDVQSTVMSKFERTSYRIGYEGAGDALSSAPSA